MEVIVVKNYEEMSEKAGEIFAKTIEDNPQVNLGLATGSTPIGMYKALIRAHEAGLDFSKVQTFNLDEYIGLPEGSDQSYRYFMHHILFDHVNLDPKNTHFPSVDDNGALVDGAYEKEIQEEGGIDMQVLGVGRNGHIAFNEPNEEGLHVNTSIVQLTKSTIEANSRFFEPIDDVPTTAVSMGMGTILKARKIVLLASGEDKREAIQGLVNGKLVTTNSPVSFLNLHRDVTVIVDEAAYGEK